MAVRIETISVPGTVLYCDACHARGPQRAYDSVKSVIDLARQAGWSVDATDTAVCRKCLVAGYRGSLDSKK